MDFKSIKELVAQALAEIISEAQDPEELPYEEPGVTPSATFFENVGSVIRAADNELESDGYEFDASRAYNLMAVLLEMALVYDWLGDDDQWQKIIELFYNRSGELAGEGRAVIVDTDIPVERMTSIVDYIVRNWIRNTTAYEREEFTVDEKVFMIRGIIIGLRNSRYLKYDPWLKTLLAYLAEDWKLLGGGGFGSGMGSGPVGWSYGG